MGKESPFPVYEQPPVVETVYSVQFDPLAAQSVRIAQYWPLAKDRYKNIGVAQRLPAVFEPTYLAPNFQPLTISFEQDNRVVFDGQSYLLQLQNDRFLMNWRKTATSSPYPGFNKNFPQFKEELGRFSKYCHNEQLGELSFNQLELTYVNFIENVGFGQQDFSHIFVDHYIASSGDRFLPNPESFNWSTSYKIPNGFGRLHTAANTVFVPDKPDGTQIIRVELTARGFVKGEFDRWFECAHEWVVKGFSDLVSVEFQQKHWGRIS